MEDDKSQFSTSTSNRRQKFFEKFLGCRNKGKRVAKKGRELYLEVRWVLEDELSDVIADVGALADAL
jgi:hypothetical protein